MHSCCCSSIFSSDISQTSSNKTCTQEKCQCVIPTFQKDIPFAPVKDFDFTPVKVKKRKIDCALADSTLLTSKNT